MWTPRRTRVTPYTVLRRERILPEPGEILVNIGDFVQAADVVARLSLPSGLCVVDVARELGVRGQDITPFLTKDIGERVEAGDALAVRRGRLGLSLRSCRAPVEGWIWRVIGSQVLLEGEPQNVKVQAYLRGHVIQVLDDLGVIVESAAAWIEGAWGAGGEGLGVLKVLTEREESLRASTVDISCHGSVAACGLLQHEGALRQLIQVQTRGLIVGSLSLNLVPLVKEAGLPLVATEGLGQRPMTSEIYSLLQNHEGGEVSLLGTVPSLEDRSRPEVVIPVSEPDDSIVEPHAEIALGDRVRLLRGALRGEMGIVAALPWHPGPVEEGQRLGAWVHLDDGRAVFVPWNNLDLIV